MGPKDEAGLSPLNQPGAIWEKSGVWILSTLERDLGGGMGVDGNISDPISPKGDS